LRERLLEDGRALDSHSSGEVSGRPAVYPFFAREDNPAQAAVCRQEAQRAPGRRTAKPV
jgi:hypothetical protein